MAPPCNAFWFTAPKVSELNLRRYTKDTVILLKSADHTNIITAEPSLQHLCHYILARVQNRSWREAATYIKNNKWMDGWMETSEGMDGGTN